MNDYLFNPAGEPEEDVRELERVLGELKFKAAPLDFDRVETSDTYTPVIAPTGRRRRLFSAARMTPTMLAAASVIFTAVALGLWFTWFMSHSPTLVHAPAADTSKPNIQNPEPAVSFLSSKQPDNQSKPSPVAPFEVESVRQNISNKTTTAREPARSARNAGRPRKPLLPRNNSNAPRADKTPAVAAGELLLALDITQRTLDKAFGETQQKMRSQFSAVRLPAFMTDTAR